MTLDLGLASEIDRAFLNANVRRLVRDRGLRVSLQRRSLDVFPEDPTRDLAIAVLSEVFQGTEM
jgi:hypothetical protein